MYQYRSPLPIGARIRYEHRARDTTVVNTYDGVVCGIGKGCVFVNPTDERRSYQVFKVRLEHIVSPNVKALINDGGKSELDLFTRAFIHEFGK